MPKAASRFTPAVKEGSRILPPKAKDVELKLRIDGGHYNPADKKLNVVLQINKEAKSPCLVEQRKKFTSHYKFASKKFDTGAGGKQGELERVLDSLCAQRKGELKKLGR